MLNLQRPGVLPAVNEPIGMVPEDVLPAPPDDFQAQRMMPAGRVAPAVRPADIAGQVVAPVHLRHHMVPRLQQLRVIVPRPER